MAQILGVVISSMIQFVAGLLLVTEVVDARGYGWILMGISGVTLLLILLSTIYLSRKEL